MDLTQAYLREILDYDSETGHFTWRKKISIKVVVGKRAGAINKAGYIVVGIHGTLYYAHRLAWLYVTGEWPDQVDHENNRRGDNWWSNLRLATHQQNVLNAKLAKNNTSGSKGVHWHAKAGKWAASIYLNGCGNHLVLFDDRQQSADAYMNAALSAQPEFARAK